MSSPQSVSEKQLAANRANALRSTGPRTPEGKARSLQNARKHGFNASTFGVPSMEDLQEISRLKDDLLAAFSPANAQELFALERMAIAQQALLRAARLESGLFWASTSRSRLNADSTRQLSELLGAELACQQGGNFRLAEGLHQMSRQSNAWQVFLRYQAQAERSYHRAVDDFRRVRALRDEIRKAEVQNEPVSGPQPQQNEAANAKSEANPFPASPAPEA